ncbi:MAG: diaminopimelate epimerase [Marinifilaceae bacterium]
MQIEFAKYQGTGNDFVLIDNRQNIISPQNIQLIQHLCDRKFGIGADGLMLLENENSYDFRMRYFNSDGKEASMCGNGGRCIVAFAYHLGIIKEQTHFIAVDGEHDANVLDQDGKLWVSLKMQDVQEVETGKNYFYLNTGSPHYVTFIEQSEGFDTYTEGKNIRYNERFKKEGTNVNFVQIENDLLRVSTYERGVEDETLSCGTGVVASALSSSLLMDKPTGKLQVKTKGGDLQVRYHRSDQDNFTNIWLEGPATKVFKGNIQI